MEIWTRQEGELGWKPWTDMLQGLASLSRPWAGAVLLVCESPDVEMTSVLATVSLIRRLTGPTTAVIVGSPHPSKEWLTPLAGAGIDQAWILDGHIGGSHSPGDRVGEPAVAANICPALHSRTAEGTTLSVCGRHGDRMVLAHHHLHRWCLGRYLDCPHWRGEHDA